MRLLLDTHLLLWSLYEPTRLPPEALAIQRGRPESVWVSLASLWEIEIKHQRHPELMPMAANEVLDLCLRGGICYLPMRPSHVFALNTLRQRLDAKPHADPFDRMLICQAKTEGLTLLTHDRQLATYGEPCVRVV